MKETVSKYVKDRDRHKKDKKKKEIGDSEELKPQAAI